MTWLVPNLRNRVNLCEPVQDPNSVTGGFDRKYKILMTFWAGVKPISIGQYITKNASQYIRGEQIEERITHEFKIRYSAITQLGKSFASGFKSSFDSIADLVAVKSNYFLFMSSGSAYNIGFNYGFSNGFTSLLPGPIKGKGRLFRIRTVKNINERNEYALIMCQEIESIGDGARA